MPVFFVLVFRLRPGAVLLLDSVSVTRPPRLRAQTLEDVTPSWFVLDHGEQLKQQAEAAAETAERARAAERRAKAEREEKLANSDGAEGPPTQPRRKLRLAKK
jgi:hypothetical protein